MRTVGVLQEQLDCLLVVLVSSGHELAALFNQMRRNAIGGSNSATVQTHVTFLNSFNCKSSKSCKILS